MSLFDPIRCDYPLPDPRIQDAEFQTKDLWNSLSRDTITRAGRLVRRRLGVDLIAEKDSAGQAVDNQPSVDVGYHGDLQILTVLPDDGVVRRLGTPTLTFDKW